MLSKRVKYALAHLSHHQHIARLARPNLRRVQKGDRNILTSAFVVPRAALKCRPSKRIKIMSQPRNVNKKFDPTKAATGYPRIHPKTLNAQTSKRTVDLALPKRSIVVATKTFATGNKTMTIIIKDLLSRIHNSRYQKYRMLCNALARQRAAREAKQRKKLHMALSKPEDWTRHKEVLKRLAEPKPIPTPRVHTRGKWRKFDPTRVEFLSMPVTKDSPESRDPFKVPPSALTYVITKRIKEIAFKKNPPEYIPPKIPGAVSPAAVKAVASPRTIILAKPAVRPAGVETDLKEDAFSVPRQALKARCPPRIRRLARPKTYGKS
ncbi:uncharacterized protein LOC107271754 [Cephus cinctus]|uniref:Uncharacterized protein LOC107271754 n=1 Tax=Cephus cinctus TaxID=211228 RepID=A0AAJ7W4Z7_CEPCN|nr:uncharacterized protein LOC107271754 [Cephus cinctus]XP_024944794.1 uncharacterized protein LOC107271754 [Cephus cinctus]